MTAFTLVGVDETPRSFHGRDLPEPARAEVWWNRPTEPALVLGSTQRAADVVDEAACVAAGIDVVRRRSGGGAVLLIPGEVVWFDVIIPTGAVPDLGDDVHAPMRWIGRRIADALAAHLDGAISVHGAGMATTPWSSLLCFDGLGPGEVLLDGHKLVGISQRRTRHASRLQCCWYLHHDPSRIVSLMRADLRPSPGDLAPIATAPLSDAMVAVVLGELLRSISD